MTAIENKKSVSKWIHVMIALLITFSFGSIPAPEPITHMGMQVMGVFFGMLWGWCFTGDMIWPSILGIVALGMTEYTNISGSLTAFFGNTTTQQMLICMIYFGYMAKCGLSSSLARWIFTKKFINGRPWVLAISLAIVEVILASLVSLVVTILIVWQIFSAACEELGYEKGEDYPAFVMIGTLLAGSFGSMLLPFRGGGLLLTGLIRSGSGLEIPMVQYFLTVDVVIALLITLYFVVAKFWIKPDTSKFMAKCDYFDKIRKENVSLFTEEQKPQIISLIVFTIALFAVGLWPKTWPFYEILANLGIQGCVSLLIMFLIIIEGQDGKPELNFSNSFFKGVHWDMVLLLGASFPVADAIKSNDCGLVAFATQTLTPLLQGLGFVPFLVVSVTVLCVASQFAHNLILQMVFVPLTCPIVVAAGFNPIVSSIVIYFGCNFAYFTPGASMIGAMYFGSEWIPNKNIYKWLLPFVVIGSLALIAYMMLADFLFI